MEDFCTQNVTVLLLLRQKDAADTKKNASGAQVKWLIGEL